MTFDEALDLMTAAQASWVRSMRVEEERTWRWIAEEWSARFCAEDPQWDFYSGRLVCERAAARLGEDSMSEPWN